MMKQTVFNMATGETLEYIGIPAKQAVICAYAQGTKKDFNTWDYAKRYEHLVHTFTKNGKTFHTIGDWSIIEK